LKKDYGKTYTYDELLVCLFHCFISDPEIKNAKKWRPLLHAVNEVLAMKDDELFVFVKQHVTDDDRRKYNYHMLVRSFRTALEGAFLMNIASQSAAANCALLALLKEVEYSFADKWIAEIATASITWINHEMQLISDMTKAVNDKKTFVTSADSASVVELLMAFDEKNGFDHLDQISSALEGIEMYAELLREKVRHTVWDATVVVSKGGNKAAAARFDSKIYFYCNDEQKKQIKAVYPAEMLSLPESEFSADECEKAAMRFNEAGNYSSAFEWYMMAANKGRASAMNSIGVAYALGHGVIQSEEKAVFWYKKAASHDDPNALHNLASRMFNGTYPGGKSKAKEYWIRSFLQEQQPSVRSRLDANFPGWHTEKIIQLNQPRYRWKHNLEPLAEAGILHAQYLAGVRYHEGGFLWQRDDEKSKELLLKAANGGFTDAKEYLLSKFGINVDMVDFDWDEDTEIVGDCAGMYIEFCGVRKGNNEYVLRFWATNNAKHKRNLWLKSITINGELVDSFEKIGEFDPEDSDWGEYAFELQKYSGVQKLRLQIEVDDEDDDELATCCELEVTLNFTSKEVTFESTELEHKLGQITLSADEYSDTVICDGKVHGEFCGINLDAEEDCEFTFWFDNHLDRNICVWATGFKVDGDEHEDSPIKIAEIEARNCSYCSMTIPAITPYISYDFDMVIEIDDELDEKLYEACTLHISLDGEGGIEESHKSLEPIAKTQKEPPKPVQMSILYTPGSRYIRNYEKNGIELYFSIIPPEMVRSAMKAAGWRWFQSKGCWYNKFSEESLDLAQQITGGE